MENYKSDNNENKMILNKVKNRFLFISPSVKNCLEPEAKITDFEILDKIGEGSFGKVYRVKHRKTGAIYAIKSIDKLNKNNQEGKPYFRREIEIMYKIHHPNIVRLFGHFEDDANIHFVLEYIPKGNLFTILSKQKTKCFDVNTVAHLIKDLICSVYYLHNMEPPIIHRDIKPENVLLDAQNKIKLTDFGWSNYIEDSGVRSTFCGTPVYLAPEMIKESGHDHNLDIWCIGILMFELLTGNIPFQGSDQQSLNGNILKNKIVWPRDMDLSAKDLISKILKTEPSERIPLKEMLKHPFFLKNCEKPNENLYKPSDETPEDKAIYLLSIDTPQIMHKPQLKRKENNKEFDKDSSNSSTSASTVTNKVNTVEKNACNINLVEKDNLNKLVVDNEKLKKEYNSLKEDFDELRRKYEDLNLKHVYYNKEKSQLIKERDEIEGQKLEYQKQIAELKQSLFEFDNKIRIMKNEITIKENRIQLDNNEIDRLNNEIEELIIARENERKIFNNKIQVLERKLACSENIDPSDLVERTSLKVVYDETEKIISSPLRDQEDKLKKDNEELIIKLESIKSDFTREKDKLNFLLKNKEEEIKKLTNEKSTKKDSETRKFDMIANKYENTVRTKDTEIENLKARIKKLESAVSNDNLKF